MKTRMVEEREGEDMGPIDWSYDFEQHARGGMRPDSLREAVARLRKLDASPESFLVTTDGGWPRIGWHDVLRVRMYDGWPYWKPTPSVLTAGVLGAEWHPFTSITDIREKTETR